MFHRNAAAVSNEDRDVALKILQALPDHEREAVVRYYLDGENEDRIEQDLGLTKGRLRELRCSVKARFFERRHFQSSAEPTEATEGMTTLHLTGCC